MMGAIARALLGIGVGVYFVYVGLVQDSMVGWGLLAAGTGAALHSAWHLWKWTRHLR